MKRLLLLGLCAAALAGCGGDDGDDSEGQAAGGGEIEIVESDFAITPATVRVDAAGETTFRIINEGDVEHRFELESGELDIEEETETIAPGESVALTVDLEEGEYEFYCPIADHRERGMEGTLIVGSEG